jgi:hypothetical protein
MTRGLINAMERTLRERLTGFQSNSPLFTELKGLFIAMLKEPAIFPVRNHINLDYTLPPACLFFIYFNIIFSSLP